jgi:antitoxin HicB
MRAEFPDVPEANTFGEDADEALIEAVDALESPLSMCIEYRRDIPKPSPVRPRGKAVTLPALTEAKLALYPPCASIAYENPNSHAA